MTAIDQLEYDFRSDTVTQPGPAMKEAMINAELGDDVYEEDPTLQALETRIANMLGKESALFFPSGSMANLTALMTLSQPGKVLYAGRNSHVKLYEVGSYARLAGLNLFEIEDEGGLLNQEQLEQCWQPDIYYMPEPGIVEVENTHNMLGGLIYPEAALAALSEYVHGRGVPMHMDGARLFHAAVATGQPPTFWTRHVDTVMVCMSKGLGAPVGSLLAGSSEIIKKARRVRKLLGGGMRQAGILAAAGLFAMDHHLPLLEMDNMRCRRFYETITPLPWLEAIEPQTNILVFHLHEPRAHEYADAMGRHGFRLLPINNSKVRIVFHLNLTDSSCEQLAQHTLAWSPKS